jgi:hypothetical protein
MDQVYAKAIEGITPIASLQLRCAGGENQGCEDGYPCVYGEVVSWEGSNPLTPLTKPQTIFDLLFSGFDPSLSNAELERIRRQRLSVLDPVLEQSQRLQAKLSGDDRGRIEEYFSAVRDLEHRIETQSSAASCDPSLLEIAGGYDDETDAAYYATMMDLIVLALQCDQTRVVSFMLNSALNFRRYEFLGIEKTHHYMTHSRSAGEDPSNLEGCKTINRWEVEQLAALLQKLSETPDASGDSLLDNTIVYFANEMAMYSQSGKTSHSDKGIPIVVGGRGGGLQTGRHLEYDDLPTADLFTTLLQKMGVDIDRFGDVGNGPLDL